MAVQVALTWDWNIPTLWQCASSTGGGGTACLNRPGFQGITGFIRVSLNWVWVHGSWVMLYKYSATCSQGQNSRKCQLSCAPNPYTFRSHMQERNVSNAGNCDYLTITYMITLFVVRVSVWSHVCYWCSTPVCVLHVVTHKLYIKYS